jgi:hypothetical protein
MRNTILKYKELHHEHGSVHILILFSTMLKKPAIGRSAVQEKDEELLEGY